ncbi:Development/cell death domain-containing protein [Dioscorea alata]|uniref:Development/cell death domain-containing protein n=2 Tax=Dioscorea alata TaxID=55571 RepID=A0ACB7UNW2_DIOAL|nr:Development/cell death domain-containing protein [Dioscorea alata]KAH7662113.1 Development/cell death domain-containing protein [Dioscorea alata]
MDDLWHLGDEFRGQSKASEDHQWSVITSKLAELTRTKGERMNNLDISKSPQDVKPWEKYALEDTKFDSLNLNLMNLDFKINEVAVKSPFRNGALNMNTMYQKSNMSNINSINGFKLNSVTNKYAQSNSSKDVNNNINHNNIAGNKNVDNINNNNNNNLVVDKRFKTLPSAEMLPRNEVLGGYIFVCNNDTMQEDLKRQLFGLPPRYRDSVRAITPGLPLFLYNYTTHQLHGIFEAASFGGTNIDPTAWEDKKCKGESRFPAQVRIRVRKICKALEEDSFRPVLFHYDGPKFRLELSIKETLDLLDLCEKAGM